MLYGGSSDSRWHEAGHGTAFRTGWMADALYQLASFMVLRRPTVWRWSHSRHHTDTIIVGRDPEIVQPRPPSFLEIGARPPQPEGRRSWSWPASSATALRPAG